jgi:carbon monoxide dehydrogenase subunit G
MTITTILGYGAGALALLVGGTYLLPRHVSVERSASIKGDPTAIIAMAASSEGYQRFNPYKNTDPKLKISLFGPASGVGSGFHFDGKDGKGSQVVSAVDARKVTYAIDLGSMGKPTSSISVAPDGEHTKVTWRTEMDMGMNPIGRVFGLFMDRMLGGTYETGLKNIETAIKASA